MASPVPILPRGGGPWNGQHAQQQQQQQQQQQYQQQNLPAQASQAPQAHQAHQAEVDGNGVQIKAMGLKVHYTFDKEAKVNCLARYPQPLQVQTVPIDETNSIGVVDLRSCIHAITECSPELAGQENDYTIYAVDFSEPDFPLVGQGMLSWTLQAMQGDLMMQSQPKLVTGRVTKNLLGVFGGGSRETLEVRLRLSVAPRPNKPSPQYNNNDVQQHNRPMESAMTPTGTSEWNAFIQSNPQIGQMGHVSRVASPAPSQGHGHHYSHQPSMMGSQESFAPVAAQQQQMPTQDAHRIAPVPVDPSEQRADGGAPSSRPSSRTSNRAPRRKPPTGRPRGRPRKKPAEGNTSGYEDGTEGEDGPSKKRVKTTQVERTAPSIFASGPESLRVAASTSGSLRTFRPILANNEGASGNSNHLQKVPRAPTPVPDGPLRTGPGRGPGPVKLRRESTLSQQPFSNNSSFAASGQPLSPSQDGRSPESMAPTPNYSVDSPADIGSSPPMQQATPFLRSSPPPSSPVLPPMPPTEMPQDASFATDDLDQLFGDEANTPIPAAPTKEVAGATARKPTESRNASGVPVQVFQMQDGPAGQDLVHICSYNTPQLVSAMAKECASDTQSLPPLQKAPRRRAARKKTKPASPPGMAPTPPPTTDAVENAVSPLLTAESGMDETARRTSNLVSIAPKPTAEQLQPQGTEGDVEKEEEPTREQAVEKASRQMGRSQSAGPLALPAIPASEPAGPSCLSQSTLAEYEFPAPPAPSALKRAASTGPPTLPVPASDPIVPIALPTSMEQVNSTFAKSDAVPAPSSPATVLSRANKNIVKRHAIKQRLEEAIMNGEMPPYCSNCGAIETPTWRKIWVQENDGIPEYCEYSEKPGKITAIEILQRDTDGKPTVHRLVKKSLGSSDDRTKWQQRLLCNPCGIWLTKCKSHRPQDRWDKDLSRVGQERRKRGTGRSKKSRGKDDGGVNPTSEAYLPTDALGPIEPSSPKNTDLPESQPGRDIGMCEASASLDMQELQSNPGSTHSRGSDTAKSPVDVEFDQAVGSTKRLLFPSPRKDGTPKTLDEININIVQTFDECLPKGSGAGKENMASTRQDGESNDDDELEAVFKSPALARPSTPTQSSKAGTPNEPFKTPTRPTPSHRPITRSISRSIRSARSMESPSQAFVQGTPTKMSRLPESGLPRRSPRNHQEGFEVFDTPISRTISQMFSEGNGFGGDDLDLSSLPALDGNASSMIDFANLLSTDAVMPSSPPKDGSISFDYHASSSVWAQWEIDTNGGMDTN